MNLLIFEPGVHFPQCHASCLLPLDDGRMLCVYFAGTHEKHDNVGIWLSEYDGMRWLSPRLVVKCSNEPHWNPVLFHTQNGVRLVFKAGREIPYWRSYTMFSADDGRTWGEASLIEDDYNRGFCYPAIHFLGNGEMLISYCSGGEKDGTILSRTTINKIKYRD